MEKKIQMQWDLSGVQLPDRLPLGNNHTLGATAIATILLMTDVKYDGLNQLISFWYK